MKRQRYKVRKLREHDKYSYDRKGARRYNFGIYDLLDWQRPPVYRVATEDAAYEIAANLNERA